MLVLVTQRWNYCIAIDVTLIWGVATNWWNMHGIATVKPALIGYLSIMAFKQVAVRSLFK